MNGTDIQLRKRSMDSRTMNVYKVLFVACAVLSVVAFATEDVPYGVLSAAVAVIVLGVMTYDKMVIHIPPMILVLTVLFIGFNVISKMVLDHPYIESIGYFFMGMILSLCGFVIAYVAIGKMPGALNERSTLIGLEAFTFGIAAYSLAVTIAKLLEGVGWVPDYNVMFGNMIAVILGSAAICILYLLEKRAFNRSMRQYAEGRMNGEGSAREISVKHTLFNMMYINSETFGISKEGDRYAVYEIADMGETMCSEFKSTLRMNLRDPNHKKDSRMEKAVLKTVVAFLNTDGGDLLVGVNDDGKIIGVDEEGFDNRDKMNLHMTNLLSSQIGSEFLPYIKFEVIDFDPESAPERFEVRPELTELGMKPAVIRVRCRKCPKPVFLKEGTNEIYYARSGPSSVELTGTNLIRYVATRSRLFSFRKSPIVGIKEEEPADPKADAPKKQ